MPNTHDVIGALEAAVYLTLDQVSQSIDGINLTETPVGFYQFFRSELSPLAIASRFKTAANAFLDSSKSGCDVPESARADFATLRDTVNDVLLTFNTVSHDLEEVFPPNATLEHCLSLQHRPEEVAEAIKTLAAGYDSVLEDIHMVLIPNLAFVRSDLPSAMPA